MGQCETDLPSRSSHPQRTQVSVPSQGALQCDCNVGTHSGLEKQTLLAVWEDPGRTPPKVSPQEYWGVRGQDTTSEGRRSQEEVGSLSENAAVCSRGREGLGLPALTFYLNLAQLR